MHKLFLLLIATSISTISLFSQSCLPDGITFSTQEEINNFQELYPNCTEIEGDVIISGNNIKDLSSLSVLTAFGKKLNIEYNDSLTSLSGLDNVVNIGSSFIIEFNNSLVDFSGLGSIEHIGGDFEVRRNKELIDLSGLNSIETIGNKVIIYKNENLKNFIGMESLKSIGDFLTVYYNPSLNNLNGFNSVKSLGGLMIYNNLKIKDFSGLDSLETISKDMLIYFNDSLMEITALMNLKSINGELWINDNPLLQSLSGIDNIDANTIEQLFIFNNQSLSECEVNSICDFIAMGETSDGPLLNAEGCNTTNQIKAACESLSTHDLQNSKLIGIYPNPSNQGFIDIKTTNIIDRVRIYNQFGQIVYDNLNPNNRINISKLDKGLYVIKVVINSKTFNRKIIIE